jgi:hypothetical protein
VVDIPVFLVADFTEDFAVGFAADFFVEDFFTADFFVVDFFVTDFGAMVGIVAVIRATDSLDAPRDAKRLASPTQNPT